MSARPRKLPASRPADGRRAGAYIGTITAISESAQDAACCGVYHNDRGSPSTVSPRWNQEVTASMLRGRNPSSGRPCCQKDHPAYSPSALAASSASSVATMTGPARGTAHHAAMKIAATNSRPAPSALIVKYDWVGGRMQERDGTGG